MNEYQFLPRRLPPSVNEWEKANTDHQQVKARNTANVQQIIRQDWIERNQRRGHVHLGHTPAGLANPLDNIQRFTRQHPERFTGGTSIDSVCREKAHEQFESISVNS